MVLTCSRILPRSADCKHISRLHCCRACNPRWFVLFSPMCFYQKGHHKTVGIDWARELKEVPLLALLWTKIRLSDLWKYWPCSYGKFRVGSAEFAFRTQLPIFKEVVLHKVHAFQCYPLEEETEGTECEQWTTSRKTRLHPAIQTVQASRLLHVFYARFLFELYKSCA